jgi:hypothetical protein
MLQSGKNQTLISKDKVDRFFKNFSFFFRIDIWFTVFPEKTKVSLVQKHNQTIVYFDKQEVNRKKNFIKKRNLGNNRYNFLNNV